ncbi:MAG: aromatic ring-hydroxylating dioxygenase subunit alpha [Acidobacteria bacterium]|nr:aromatic ring-hydroxylating dioxygenase subunit alpha [Acidobacteriota bacterium]
MEESVKQIIDSYSSNTPLAEAWTIPASWYVDPRIMGLEHKTVFARSWQYVGRAEQVRRSGQYITCELAGEPLLIVRGNDQVLRGFFNVCRHHAAAVMTEAAGETNNLRCPYHGWTYSLEGELRGTPDFAGVCNFDREANGLVPVETQVWENWVFVKLEPGGPSLATFLGAEFINQLRPLELGNYHWLERRHYALDCNWKVFIDNYLDGGYHIPYLHKGLNSVLDYGEYEIEIGERFCLQSSPVVTKGAEAQTGAVRKGDRALYCWIYPNFIINWYEGVMDTNIVIPCGVDQCEVIFDFYFTDISEKARERNLESLAVSERIQDEDVSICKSVQRGLNSRAYKAGRLSVRREAGEHLFHKLLHADFRADIERQV